MNAFLHRHDSRSELVAAMTDARLHVRLIGSSQASVALRRDRPVTLGRARDCDLHVDDPLVSRRHALIHGGEIATFEDLGSENGSWRRCGPELEELAPTQRVALALGDVLAVGSRFVVVHHGGPAFTRMTSDLAVFESAVALACGRAESVAVIRAQVVPSTDPDLSHAALVSLASIADGVSCSALHGHELALLLRCDPVEAASQARRLAVQLAALAVGGDVGLAVRGPDGVTAGDLLAAAAAAVATMRAPRRGPRGYAGEPARHHMLVGKRGRHLVLPSGERVDLARHVSLRLIVLALARQRLAGSTGLSCDDLLACGWPGERVDPFAGNARVRVALSRLRSLGLRELLVRGDDGYVLAPELTVEIEDDRAD